MRRFRQRRRARVKLFRIELQSSEVNGLVRILNPQDQRQDPDAVHGAIMAAIYRVLDGGR
jgi:hypothetical protein